LNNIMINPFNLKEQNMLKKSIFALLVFSLVWWSVSTIFGATFQANRIPLDQRIGSAPPTLPGDKAYCVIQNDDGSTASYFGGFSAGDGIAVYMDPTQCGVPNPYPFRVTDAHLYLYDDGNGTMVWPVQIQVNIRDVVGGNPCNGPGGILCSETFTIPADSGYPILMNLSLGSLCCVNGPFFIEIIYPGGTSAPYPSPLFADEISNPADTCYNWLLYGGVYYEWDDIWYPPVVGNAIIRATGNTQDPGCQLWPDHKMHFPQLPDLIGWDVNATMPMILADDWQCSQTGWVTDIHFWGSWKDMDGDPVTDEVGQIQFFQFGIYSNLPVGDPQNPFPYSVPGTLLWSMEEWVPGTPTEPPTLEAWYDPWTGSVIPNDHVPYWQYDFVDIPQPFYQDSGAIYWLSISAVLADPQNFVWGWKNSRDHFEDDAVFMSPTGEWVEMYEPPRSNRFSVFFDGAGVPMDQGSTNYYGQGWYYYDMFSWWNMWFYDNPFTYEHPKEINLDMMIEPFGPAPIVQFAINWSTDLWSMEGEPGRPPLPEDEFVNPGYIGRQEFAVYLGDNPIYFTLPYNPEWVSIDFRGQDFMINGMINHECVQTSMDLAFVITGHEGVPPILCGDVTNDGVVDAGDVVYMVNYLYRSGPLPVPLPCVGDVNNDDVVDAGDVVWLINYLYRGGSAPDPNCCNPSWKK
jgi:hypothetical protein